MNGFIYVMLNPAMPGLHKVGKTTRDPQLRQSELSRATGVASPFILIYSQPVQDCDAAEKWVHEELDKQGFRHMPNREFFNAQSHIIIELISRATNIISPNKIKSNNTSIQKSNDLITGEEIRLMADKWANGNGVPRIPEKALKLYEQAAAMGDYPSIHLGVQILEKMSGKDIEHRKGELYYIGYKSGHLILARELSLHLIKFGFTDHALSVWKQFYSDATHAIKENPESEEEIREIVKNIGWNYFHQAAESKFHLEVPVDFYEPFRKDLIEALEERYKNSKKECQTSFQKAIEQLGKYSSKK